MSYILAIDQGTSGTRCGIFDASGEPVSVAATTHRQSFPHPGWVEMDAMAIWHDTCAVIERAIAKAPVPRKQITAIGLANQRETVVAWDRQTGVPFGSAIGWQDTRTADLVANLRQDGFAEEIRRLTGLIPSSYFSAPKMRAALHGVGVAGDRVAVGTVDSWLMWNLTGGTAGGVHVTDHTNASRTMLMDLDRLRWHPILMDRFGIDEAWLPTIVPSIGTRAVATHPAVIAGIPISGVLGDQQSAALGVGATGYGDTKATYGTGAFILSTLGRTRRDSPGLLTTVASSDDTGCVYALEGAIGMAGSLVDWLVDRLGVADSAEHLDRLAGSVADSSGVVLVPAFSGLLAPHWRDDARGAISGLTLGADNRHIARAAWDAIASMTADVLDAIAVGSDAPVTDLVVDGGVSRSDLLLQRIADVAAVDVRRSSEREATLLGAAVAAGIGVGVWRESSRPLRAAEGRTFHPALTETVRLQNRSTWARGVAAVL
jgi:glycerol kinase